MPCKRLRAATTDCCLLLVFQGFKESPSQGYWFALEPTGQYMGCFALLLIRLNATLVRRCFLAKELAANVQLNFPTNKQIPAGMTNETYPVDKAYMFMDVLQPALTHTIRREVDPLEWAELVGSIGGTWGEWKSRLSTLINPKDEANQRGSFVYGRSK